MGTGLSRLDSSDQESVAGEVSYRAVDRHRPSLDPRRIRELKSQDYETVLAWCRREGFLWEDKLFPADYASVYLDGRERFPIQWLRPLELSDRPAFERSHFRRLGLGPGAMGDRLLLAALSTLAERRELLAQLCPHDPVPFDDRGYAGVFGFRLWHFGEWASVAVDDRLPCFEGRLLMLQSLGGEPEFWGALLEKAYAKFV